MDLTEGNITGRLVRFTIPIIIIQFLNQAYTMAANIVVARFVSEEALSVLSTVNSALLVAYCLMHGLRNLCGAESGYREKRPRPKRLYPPAALRTGTVCFAHSCDLPFRCSFDSAVSDG